MNPDQEKSQLDGSAEWKREGRIAFWSRLIRWGLAIPLVLFSIPLFGFWFGPFFVALGGLLVAWDVTNYFAQFFGRLLYPKCEIEHHPLYSIAQALAAKGKYVEAEKEYEKIIQEFPNEAKPHLDLIRIAAVRLNDAELAEKLYLRGMQLLKDADARQTLTRMYAETRSQLTTGGGEKNKVVSREKMDEIRDRLARDRSKMWK